MTWYMWIFVGLFIGFWIYLYRPRMWLMQGVAWCMKKLHELLNRLDGRD